MYYVYILYSKKLNKKYFGVTNDLRNRIVKHNSADGSDFTKKGIPWTLIHYQAFVDKSDAYAEEKFLKSGRGRDRLKYLLKNTMKKL